MLTPMLTAVVVVFAASVGLAYYIGYSTGVGEGRRLTDWKNADLWREVELLRAERVVGQSRLRLSELERERLCDELRKARGLLYGKAAV